MDLDLKKIVQQVTELATTHGLKFLLALVFLWVGWKAIQLINKGIEKWFERADYDPALETFVQSLVSMGLKILLVVTAAGIAGFPTTSLVAMLGAAGLAVGMALSGTLQNFAGGILLLVLKPFKIGDFIEASGHCGTVKRIQIFNTIINTPDNKRIILPNGPVATGAITNFSAEPKRRIDLLFGIGYQDNIDEAKDTILALIQADTRIDRDPAPFLAVSELADSSVNIVVRVWADSGNYWGVYFDLTENVKKTFDQKGISIPYPQRDLHLYNHNKG